MTPLATEVNWQYSEQTNIIYQHYQHYMYNVSQKIRTPTIFWHNFNKTVVDNFKQRRWGRYCLLVMVGISLRCRCSPSISQGRHISGLEMYWMTAQVCVQVKRKSAKSKCLNNNNHHQILIKTIEFLCPFSIYTVSQKTGPLQIFWYNFIKTSHLWIILSR